MAGHLTGLTCMRKQALASLLVAGSRRQAGIRKRRHEVPFSRPGQAREAMEVSQPGRARILVAFLPRLDSFFIHDLPVGVLLGGGTEGLLHTARRLRLTRSRQLMTCSNAATATCSALGWKMPSASLGFPADILRVSGRM